MSQNECGCTENNCPHKTSEVTLWDGVFTNITVPEGAGLNEVLSLLENYVTTTASCDSVNYTLTAYSACLNLNAGTYSFTQIIDAIVASVCANASSIEELETAIASMQTLNTTNVTLDGIVLPSCFSAFAGTTSTDLFNVILTNLCALMNESGPSTGDGPVVVTPPDPGTTIPETPTGSSFDKNAKVELVAESIKSIVDNHSFIYEHTTPVLDTTSFSVPIYAMRGVVENFIVIRGFSETLSVSPIKDTYFYLNADGSILRREVAVAAPAPATPTHSHELYKITSDGTGCTGLVELFTNAALSAAPLGVDAVDTVNIKDDAVTTAKMAPVNVGSTVGDPSLILVRNNDEGQVDLLQSNLLIAGPTHGQVLTYNSGLSRFENNDNTAVSTNGVIPVSVGTNYSDSSITEAASQIESAKKVEINSGAMENDLAMLNVVGGPILFPRLTHSEAGLLVATDGYVVYVTSTDATFTSVGFWGVESGAWVKL